MDNTLMENEYMLRAIELAKKGAGAVNPNPLVGAVIVKDGRIIGEGYHARFGDLHAERNAIKNAKERGEDMRGAEIYVTLEPCCHHGHQPPCTEAVVEAGIKKVYVGSDDPNPLVAGKGLQFLNEHGVETVTHVMKEECDALNDVFFHYITQKTPYIVYKYAMTMDGKIATYTGNSKYVSGPNSLEKVHEMRHLYTGIMVGMGTLLADDPELTCRLDGGGRNPVRIIVDSYLSIPEDSKIVKTAKEIRTILLTTEPDQASLVWSDWVHRQKELEELGLEIIIVSEDKGKMDWQDAMEKLGQAGIDGILLEGGGRLAWQLLENHLIDEVHAFVAPKMIGGKMAISPVDGQGFAQMDLAEVFTLTGLERHNQDVELIYKKN